MSNLYLAASIQGLIFSLYVFTLRRKTQRDRLLGTYLIALSFMLFSAYLLQSGKMADYFFLYRLDTGIPFLCGPFIYFYAKSLHKQDFRLARIDLLHLLPFVLEYIFMYVFFWSKDQNFKTSVLQQEQFINPYFSLISSSLKIGGSLVYYYLSFQIIGKMFQSAESRLKRVLLPVKSLLALTTGVSFIMLSALLLSAFFPGLPYLSFLVHAIYLMLFAFIYAVLFFSLKIPAFLPSIRQSTVSDIKYSNSNIKEGLTLEVWSKAVDSIEKDKTYKNPAFTIHDAAKNLGVNTKVLSQAINDHGQQNFSTFINDFRIREFKSRVASGDNELFTIWAIAQECGFASKSSFHAVFKRHEQMTPKAFINQLSD